MRTFRSSQASAFRKLKELSIHHRNSSAVNYRKSQYNFNRNQSCTFCCIIDASIILRSEINGKENVTNYWVSSRDRGLKFRDLSWILRFFWLLRTERAARYAYPVEQFTLSSLTSTKEPKMLAVKLRSRTKHTHKKDSNSSVGKTQGQL